VRARIGEYRGWPVRVHTSNFYAAGVAALLLIAGFYFRSHLKTSSPDSAEAVLRFLVACAICLALLNGHFAIVQPLESGEDYSLALWRELRLFPPRVMHEI
jgi:hypothetical protein